MKGTRTGSTGRSEAAAKRRLRRPLSALFFLLFSLFPAASYAQTELGAVDDLTVLGADGTVPDPDVEIKGFSVFGSTDVVLFISTSPGNTVFNGAVQISSNIYAIGMTTFTGNVYIQQDKLYINGGLAGQVLKKNAGGWLEWADAASLVEGDNLGDHTATEQLRMGDYAIWSSSDISAARYQINGSTVLAVLPGVDSFAAGPETGSGSTGNSNTFIGAKAGYANTTGGENLFSGAGAGATNSTGWYNTMAGFRAGFSAAASANSFFGYQAGLNTGSGSQNLFLGYQAGASNVTGGGNIAIGYDQGLSAPDVNNELNIGGVLFGDLAAKTIGISTRVPQAALDIVSTGTAANIYAQVWRDSSGVAVASMTSEGTLYADLAVGDDLGNHVAIQGLDMSQFPLLSVSSVSIVGDGIRIATSIYSGASGVFISTAGSIQTLGTGNGLSLPNPRGLGAVDLQTRRTNSIQVSSGTYSVIGGGQGNRAAGNDSVVGGGFLNAATGPGATIAGGNQNTASGQYAVIAGGNHNTASGQYAVITGGSSNNASGSRAIVGGYLNTGAGGYSTISGGESNTITSGGMDGTISGGYLNTVRAQYATITGGYKNTAGAYAATVSGGEENTATGQYSWAGGYRSSSTANGSFTWSDRQGSEVRNTMINRTVFKNRGGFMVTPLSGVLDANLAMLDVVSTGTAADVYAQVWRDSGGVPVASMTSQGVLFATMPPGSGDNLGDHTATQDLDLAGNRIVRVSSLTITGNAANTHVLMAGVNGIIVSTGGAITTTGTGHGTVTGNARGDGAVDLQTYREAPEQVASGIGSVIGGGAANTASYLGAVSGGILNLAGNVAAVSGGSENTASGSHSAVGGGMQNNASGDRAVVPGGLRNIAAGQNSMVAGGSDNTATGNYSWAGGYYSSSTADGAFTWSDSEGAEVRND
ncbi:MAG TPA: hypothetical protein PK523_06660, partial [Elusimicrobiales bacterium]|nr:hypothetical protein [Elusimicrobiales bacterium]